MYRRFYFLFPILFILADGIIFSLAFGLNYFLSYEPGYSQSNYWISYMIATMLWLIISAVMRDYKIGRATEYSVSFNKAIRSAAIFVSVSSIAWVFFNYQELSRDFLGGLFVIFIVLLVTQRVTIHIILNRYRRWGGNYRNAVIVGHDQLGKSLWDVLSTKKDHGIKCLGFYGQEGKEISKVPVLGSINDFFSSDLSEVDFIYVSENIEKNTLNRIIQLADKEFKKVKLLPNFKTDYLKTYELYQLDHIPVLDVNNLPLDSLVNRFAKRTFDVAFSLMVLVGIFSWLFPIVALLIKLESKGPILFKQKRNGKNNEEFSCLKFRTMRVNEVADSKWATKNDPRVTYFGKLLRKTSIDELPQILNVLKGEMAIVGPRPLPVKMNDDFERKIENYRQRLSYKPGITGLAQAMGYRGEIKELTDIENRVKLDRFYLKNWSFLFDIRIITKTVFEIIKGQEGAY
ncbi:MAG: undecaprenyl-phosphate glucose phosphotransferase [Cyclobacteriaceae bacterium]